MKICLVSQEYPPETAHGGIGTQTYLKAHGLSAMGHAVHVLSRSTDLARHDYRDGLVSVTRIPGSEPRFPAYTDEADWLTYGVEVAVALTELHRLEEFDLIEFPEWAGEGYTFLLNRTEWNRVPVVVQIHGPVVMFAHTIGWPEVDSELYRLGTTVEGTSLRLADRVYSSSACSADWCARSYHLSRSSIPVMHAGVDLSLFRPAPDGPVKEPVLVFAGRVTGDKGVGVLVDAACQLAPEIPGLRVEILGRGDPKFIGQIRARAAAAGFPALLSFRGFVDRKVLPQHLQRAAIFVGPSLHEPGPGLVYLEAMGCGLPVVACSGAGAAEVVVPGRNGLLVPPNDATALASALRRLLRDPSACREMGFGARRYVEETADSASCLRRIEMFYHEVISATNVTAQ